MPRTPSLLKGLTTEEATRRRQKYGPNQVKTERGWRPVVEFLRKFSSPLLIILLVAATVSFFLGQQISAAIIYVMVFVSGLLDFINTYQSHKAAEALNARVRTTATVHRDGRLTEIPISHLVPGDIVELSAGAIVPAECLLLAAKDLYLDESPLTGESFPINKVALERIPDEMPTTVDQKDIHATLMGTSVISGLGTALIIKTGAQTAYGQIATNLSTAPTVTDFEKGLTDFSYFIMKLAVAMVVIVFAANTVAGRPVLDAFLFAIAVAVGVTPELLPVIMTVSMSHGAKQMAEKKVIVKNLSAIENFGSLTVLCADKTGTLTKDRISLVKYLDPKGQTNEDVLYHAYLTSVWHTGVPNPLDTAIARFRSLNIKGVTKIDEVPFDFQRKRSSVIVRHHNQRQLICKGAPEDIFQVASMTPAVRRTAQKLYDQLSQDGFRVLAIARRDVNRQSAYDIKDERDLELLGLIAFLDPAKSDVGETVRRLGDYGVEMKILTGDSQSLTEKIARDIGLHNKGCLTGTDIAKMTDKQLRRAVTRTTIFARLMPDQKVRIINALRANNEVVGFLGDGINDAPALKAADVGVSVDTAVDIAKDTADIILLRKSLRVLLDGIIDGRQTFQNSLKYILMGLSSNFGNMFSMMAISAFAPFLPMLPVQILLNNFLYDMSQTTLPTDNVDAAALYHPPRWDIKLIRRYMIVFGLLSSIFDFLTFAILIWGFHLAASAFQTGWFIESLTTQVLVIYVIRSRQRGSATSRPSRWLVASTLGIVALAWLIPHAKLGSWFQFTPLPTSLLWLIVGISAIYLFSAELTKRWFFRVDGPSKLT